MYCGVWRELFFEFLSGGVVSCVKFTGFELRVSGWVAG